jgi:hypothetical protein
MRSIVPQLVEHPAIFFVYSTATSAKERLTAHSRSALQPTGEQTDNGGLLRDSIVGTLCNGCRNLPSE